MPQANRQTPRADDGRRPDLLSAMFVRVCGLACGGLAALVVHLADAGTAITVLAFLAAFVAGSWLAGRLFHVARWWAWPIPAASQQVDGGHSDKPWSP